MKELDIFVTFNHKLINHGERLDCDCEYSTMTHSYLKQHQKSKPAGGRHPCDQCEYAPVPLYNLRNHKPCTHEGLRYPCDLCEYAATTISVLVRHKKGNFYILLKC